MLRLKQVFTLILCFPVSTLAETGPEVPDYPADQIAEHIYVIHGPLELPNPENQGFMNNPGIVVTSKGVVILDPGSSVQSGEMVLRAVRKISGQPVVAVFNSHIHGDHWLGNQAVRAAYPQAPIYGHPNMIEFINAGEGRNWVELMETNSSVYVPGHGPTGDKAVPERFLRYLEILYASVKHYYNEGMSDFEMKPQVAEALKDYADWSGFEEELGKHISLTYLQIEEAEF